MYLTVSTDTKELTVTTNKDEAEAFSVKYVSEAKHHHELEFSLTSTLSRSKKDAGRKSSAVVPLDYILDVSVNPVTGSGLRMNKPRMSLNSSYSRTRLLLKKRTDYRISCDTKEWIKGKEAYYLQCIRQMKSGFLCIKKRNSYIPPTAQSDNEQEDPTLHEEQAPEQASQPDTLPSKYKVCVERSPDSHDDKNEVFMLFQLQPTVYKATKISEP